MRKRSNIVYWIEDNLYLNITNRCSNNCYFCFRHYWKGIEGFNLRLTQEPSVVDIIKELEKYLFRRPWKEVVFCGFGEPLMRLDCVLEVSRWLRKRSNLPIRINTNGHGYLLNPNRNILKELKEAGVTSLSISLNAHDEQSYGLICRPAFERAYESVLEFIKNAKDLFDVEVTTVTIPEVDISKVNDLTSRLRVKFRLRPYIQCFY